MIHGTVIGQDGKPAKGIGLEAYPVGVPLNSRLPETRTNDAGEYRFERMLWGKYTVRAEDESAGYSLHSAFLRTRFRRLVRSGQVCEVGVTCSAPVLRFP